MYINISKLLNIPIKLNANEKGISTILTSTIEKVVQGKKTIPAINRKAVRKFNFGRYWLIKAGMIHTLEKNWIDTKIKKTDIIDLVCVITC